MNTDPFTATLPINQEAYQADPLKAKYDSLIEDLKAINQRGDRQETAAWIKALKEDPALADMSEKDIGAMLQRAAGGQEKAGFDRFNSNTRWLDAAGYNIMEGGKRFAGEYTGGAMRGLAGLFTEDENTLQAFQQAGEYVPGSVAMLAPAALGMVGAPALGLASMLGLTYGAGSESARARGVGGWAAPAAGVVDAAINAVFIKGAPGLGSRVADSITRRAGLSKAIMDLSKQTGESLFETAKKAGVLSPSKKVGIEIASHALTETALAGLGTGASAAKELLLYANEPGRQQWLNEWWDEVGANPDFWTTSFVTEAGFSLVGHVIGRGIESRLASDRNKVRTETSMTSDPNKTVEVDPNVKAAMERAEAETQLANSATTRFTETAAQPGKVGEFKTSRGSVYTMYDDNTSQRYQVGVPDQNIKEGTMPRSRQTVFVDPTVGDQIAAYDFTNASMRFQVNDDGTMNVHKVVDGKIVETPFESVPISAEPQVGFKPIELRDPEMRPENPQGFRGRYIGTPITEITSTKTTVDPTIPVEPTYTWSEAAVAGQEFGQLTYVQNQAAADASTQVFKWYEGTETIADAQGNIISEAIAPKILNIDQAVLLTGNAFDANTGSLSAFSPVQDALKAFHRLPDPSEAAAALRKQVVDSIHIHENLPALPADVKVLTAASGSLVLRTAPGTEMTLSADFFNQPYDPSSFADANQAAVAKIFHDDYQNYVNSFRQTVQRMVFDDNFVTPEQSNSWIKFAQDSGIHDALNTVNGTVIFVDPANTKSWVNSMMVEKKASLRLVPDMNGPVMFINSGVTRNGYLHEFGHVVDQLIRLDGFGMETRMEWEKLVARVYQDKDVQATLGVVDLTQRLQKAEGDDVTETKRFDSYYRTRNEIAANGFQGYMLGKPNKFKEFVKTNFPLLDSLLNKIADSFRKMKKFVGIEGMSPRQQYLLENFTPGGREFNEFFDSLFGSKNFDPKATEYYEKFNAKIKDKLDAVTYEKVLETFHMANPVRQKEFANVVDDLLNSGIDKDMANEMLTTVIGQTRDITKAGVSGFALNKLYQRMNEDWVGSDPLKNLQAPEDSWALWPNAKKVVALGRNHRAVVALQQAVSYHIRRTELSAVDEGMQGMMKHLNLNKTMIEMDKVMGEWLLGKLPGQEGRPAWDKGQLEGEEAKFTYNNTVGKGEKDLEALRALEETKRHYPILWEALSKIESGKSVAEYGFFYKGEGNVNTFSLMKDRADRTNKRTSFESREEADEYRRAMQDSGDYADIIFQVVPAKAGKGKTVYQIKGIKDEANQISRDWMSTLEAQSMTDWIDASFPSDPKSVKYIKGLSDVLRKADVKQEGLASFFGKVVRRSLADYQTNVFKPGEASEFHKLVNQIKSFDEQVKSSPEMQRWKDALVNEDLDIPKEVDKTTLRTEDIVLYAIEKSYKEPGFLRELQQFAPKAWTDLAESFGNFAYGVFKYEIDLDIYRRINGQEGKFSPQDYKIVNSTVDFMAPLENANTVKGVEVAQMQDPHAYNASLRAGVTRGKKNGNMAQRMLLATERNYLLTFGNIIQMGESNPLFKYAGEALVNEQANANIAGTDSIEHYTFSGKTVNTPNGRVWVKDPHGTRDDAAYLAVHGKPQLKLLADNVRRISQQTKMTFEQMQNYKGDDVKILEFISELKNDLEEYQKKAGDKFEQDYKHLDEFLLRSYSVNLTNARYVVKYERENHTYVTALALFKAAKSTEIRPEHSIKVAKELANMVPVDPELDNFKMQRVKMLMDFTGWDQMTAHKYDQVWLDGHNKITQYGIMRETTPWYVTERRHKQFLVPYIIKDASKKSGAISGMRDFETAEEASDFIKNAHKEGLIPTVKFPKDAWRQRDQPKPFSDSVQEAIDHVVTSQAELLNVTLADKVAKGGMSEEEANRIVGMVTSLKGNIAMELAAEKSAETSQRFFKHGREELDMTFQQTRGIWQDSIKHSRKVTDAIFRLFDEDPVRQSDKAYINRARQSREMLRIADGDMQQAASKAAFTMFMAANLSTGMIEVAQFPISLSHVLIENGAGVIDSFAIPLKLARQAGKASMTRIGGKDDTGVWDDPHHVKLIRMAERMGRMNIRNYMDISDDVMAQRLKAYESAANPYQPSAVMGLATAAHKGLATFYGAFNRFNAELSLTSAFEILKKKKYGSKAQLTDVQAEELYRRAMDISDLANGAHGRAGRPIWFNNRSEGMRTVAQLGWSLQSYAQSYISNWMRQMTTAFAGELKGKTPEEIRQARKSFATLTSIQLGAFGMMGIPLVGGITKAMQMAFGFNPEHELKEFLEDKYKISESDNLALTDTFLYGLQKATGTPLDIRSRLAISGIGPLSEYEGFSVAGFGGPLMGLASSIIAGYRNVQKGDDSMWRYGVNLLPAGTQRAIRLMFFDDGKVFNKAGKYIMTPSTMEAIGMMAGFSPTRYMDHVKSTMMMRHAAELDSIERTRAANDIAKMLEQPGSDAQAQAQLEASAHKLNMDPGQLANRVAQKTLERLYGPTIREGSGPHAQTASRLYQSPLPQPAVTEKALTELNTLSRLNQLPTNWQKKLQKATTLDTLMSQTGMSESEARRSLSSMNQPVGLTGFVYGSGLDQPQLGPDQFP